MKRHVLIIFLLIILNLLLILPFLLIWMGLFVLTFLGGSGILFGVFLLHPFLGIAFSGMPSFIISDPYFILSVAFFGLGAGGLLLLGISVAIPSFLSLCKNYLLWNYRLIGGNDEKK